MPEPTITRHPNSTYAVDTEYVRPGMAAAHIVEHRGRAAFIDVGTTHSVPHLLAALDQLGIARSAVDLLLLTHVHLDHAGGAGALMQALPNAKAVLHPRGAPHLIDPAKLIAGTRVVYGEETYLRLYGDIVPIAAERVITTQDGDRVDLAGRPFELIHTPGHALHHQCIVDLDHAAVFTGDTFGLSYRELDTAQGAFIVPTTTPTQFDPDQLIASIDRIASYRPEAAYLMHYSRVTDIPKLARELKSQVQVFVQIARRHAGLSELKGVPEEVLQLLARRKAESTDLKGAITNELLALWIVLARKHGVELSDERIEAVLRDDADLNAQGLVVWLERQKRAA
jgi:glyoxylase-like metal-dependent hydrolase (beta-lactamase superfamily II)